MKTKIIGAVLLSLGLFGCDSITKPKDDIVDAQINLRNNVEYQSRIAQTKALVDINTKVIDACVSKNGVPQVRDGVGVFCTDAPMKSEAIR